MKFIAINEGIKCEKTNVLHTIYKFSFSNLKKISQYNSSSPNLTCIHKNHHNAQQNLINPNVCTHGSVQTLDIRVESGSTERLTQLPVQVQRSWWSARDSPSSHECHFFFHQKPHTSSVQPLFTKVCKHPPSAPAPCFGSAASPLSSSCYITAFPLVYFQNKTIKKTYFFIVLSQVLQDLMLVPTLNYTLKRFNVINLKVLIINRKVILFVFSAGNDRPITRHIFKCLTQEVA